MDFVLSRCAPTAIQSKLRPDFAPDRLTDFLQMLEDKLVFHHGYFGHYHIGCEPDAHHSAIFGRIIPITKE